LAQLHPDDLQRFRVLIVPHSTFSMHPSSMPLRPALQRQAFRSQLFRVVISPQWKLDRSTQNSPTVSESLCTSPTDSCAGMLAQAQTLLLHCLLLRPMHGLSCSSESPEYSRFGVGPEVGAVVGSDVWIRQGASPSFLHCFWSPRIRPWQQLAADVFESVKIPKMVALLQPFPPHLLQPELQQTLPSPIPP